MDDKQPQIPKADKAFLLANEQANLGLEAMRCDLSDPRGYGNSFVDLWNWLRAKWQRGKG